MTKPTEQEFIDQYHGYVARRCARDLYRAIYPTGMHTNGPTVVVVSASHLEWLLQPHKSPSHGNRDYECMGCGKLIQECVCSPKGKSGE
jgi:hypothetical protein